MKTATLSFYNSSQNKWVQRTFTADTAKDVETKAGFFADMNGLQFCSITVK
jgi:hypothetical protein